jgi:hypothetical protein
MVPGGDPAFLDPNGTVKGVPEQATAEKTSANTSVVLAPEALVSRPSPSPTPAPGAVAPVATPTSTPARSVQPVQSSTVQSSTPTTPGR